MFRKMICFMLLILSVVFGSGCVGGGGIKSIPPISLQEVAGKRLVSLSADEKEGLIYKHIVDRVTVDKDKLMIVSEKDSRAINSLLSNVNEFLKGKNNGIMSEEYGNYMLLEFAKTPYEWQQSRVDIVGFDPAARLYFVDVTYTTTEELKKVIPNSMIVSGSEMESVYKQKRYNDYIVYLTTKLYKDPGEAAQLKSKFESAWGDMTYIMQEQQGVSLLDRVRAVNNESGGIGKLTYSGLIGDSKLNVGAKMVFRYVLKYRFNLGEEVDLEIQSIYLKNYELNNYVTILKSYQLTDEIGVEVLRPFIDRLINSYHKVVEESNHVGLCQLIDNYAGIDKYYDGIRDYTYNSTGAYTYSILSKQGTNVIVQVDRSNKIRAKGAEMSLPNYDETLICNLVLSKDDKIRIKNINPVKITLVGEPISVIRNVTGISDIIQYADVSFTEYNKNAVLAVLQKFSGLVVNQNISGDEFLSVVDLGVSQLVLQRMIDTITSINADKKITYLVSWDTATNVYVSVTVREIFEGKSGNLDTEAVIDLVNRDGEWRVINYVRTVSVRTDISSIDTSTALCIDEKN